MRKLCWFVIPGSAAIFLAVLLLPERGLVLAGFLCLLPLLGAFFFRGKMRLRIVLAALGTALGFFWTSLYGALFLYPALERVDTTTPCTALVTGYPSETAFGYSLPIRLTEAPYAEVLLYAEGELPNFRPGDTVTALISFSDANFIRGENVIMYQAKGIYLRGNTDSVILQKRPGKLPIFAWPKQVSLGMKQTISRLFPADVSGFLIALTLGDKHFLPTGLYVAFQRAGIAHVVAVSGLHISFLAGLLTSLFGKRKKSSIFLLVTLLFFFAAVAGNTPSVLRAVFMESLLLLAGLVEREADTLTLLSFVLFLLLLPCPYAAADIGLQLSFAAVAGIHLFSIPLYQKWLDRLSKADTPGKKFLRPGQVFLLGAVTTTFGALLFTTPLSVWYFGSLSLAGPLTNVLSLWAVSGTFSGALITALIGLLFPGLGRVLAEFVAWPARWVIFVSQEISRWPFASIAISSVYLLGWFLATYAIFLVCLAVRGKHVRPVLPVMCSLIMLCMALLLTAYPILTGELTIAALDVGQGSSTLFYSRGRSVLVDCGGNSFDDPGDTAADYLQKLGTSRLDALILTHYHEDHACGVPELLSRINVTQLILPDVEPEAPLRQEITDLAEEYGCAVSFVSEDFSFSFGDAFLTVFAPLGDGGANEEGLSAVCSYEDFDILVTGDMNLFVERMLVKYKDIPDIEVLIAGHHGSKNASSEELLAAVKPEWAIISSGYNRYGHPAPETLKRLTEAGCTIFRTDQLGTVTLTYVEK